MAKTNEEFEKRENSYIESLIEDDNDEFFVELGREDRINMTLASEEAKKLDKIDVGNILIEA